MPQSRGFASLWRHLSVLPAIAAATPRTIGSSSPSHPHFHLLLSHIIFGYISNVDKLGPCIIDLNKTYCWRGKLPTLILTGGAGPNLIKLSAHSHLPENLEIMQWVKIQIIPKVSFKKHFHRQYVFHLYREKEHPVMYLLLLCLLIFIIVILSLLSGSASNQGRQTRVCHVHVYCTPQKRGMDMSSYFQIGIWI